MQNDPKKYQKIHTMIRHVWYTSIHPIKQSMSPANQSIWICVKATTTPSECRKKDKWNSPSPENGIHALQNYSRNYLYLFDTKHPNQMTYNWISIENTFHFDYNRYMLILVKTKTKPNHFMGISIKHLLNSISLLGVTACHLSNVAETSDGITNIQR